MNRTRQPKYIFESSWEVCNKVGGIYTVLSTHAKTLTDAYKNKLIFVGPDLWIDKDNPLFKENKRLLSTWKLAAKSEGLNIRIGRWNIPGNPIAVLVDYVPFYEHKNDIYRRLGITIKLIHITPMVIMMKLICSRMQQRK